MTNERKSISAGSVVKWLIVVAVAAAFCFGIRSCVELNNVMNGAYRDQTEFKEGMLIVKKDARVAAALGEPISETGLAGYSSFSGTNGSSITYVINLQGPKGTGQAKITAENTGAIRIVEAVFSDSRGALTNLLVSP